jgi:D-inositol-3-phosphate glycosyltransferase
VISFVWSAKYPFYAGTGGSENYTAGHMRELQRRGIATRLITIGHGENDGRNDFPDLSFTALESKEELQQLDDTLIFVTYPLDVKTKRQSYVILHCPPPSMTRPDPLFDPAGLKGKQLIVTSQAAVKMWMQYLGTLRKFPKKIKVVYPFAENVFGEVYRDNKRPSKNPKILFAGRLTPDKGIYTLLASLHMESMQKLQPQITFTAAGKHSEDGRIIYSLLKAHPLVRLQNPGRTAEEMAEMMTNHDVVVMPTTNIFWRETFGIVSVEAQHAGCRVVASKSGGLPETNCGGLLTVKPDDPKALADGLELAIQKGPLTSPQRNKARQKFTVASSVDALLKIVKPTLHVANRRSPRKEEGLFPNFQPQLDLFPGHWKQAAYLPARRLRR